MSALIVKEIINGRSGRCSEDCKFCARSARHHTNVEEYPFLSPDEILADGIKHQESRRFFPGLMQLLPEIC